MIENNIYPHLNGSSRVRIGDATDVLCSIKLEIAEPDFITPDEGKLDVHVDISPSCNISVDDRVLQSAGSQIASSLESVYVGSSSIDLRKFSIITGKYCWSIQIDLLILQLDGDPLDVCSIAIFVALYGCKVPRVELIAGESGSMEDFDVFGDLSDCLPIACTDIPICITVLKVGGKFIVDSNMVESACSSCTISIALNRLGQYCGIHYLKSGILIGSELDAAVALAIATTQSIFQQLDTYCGAQSIKCGELKYEDVVSMRSGFVEYPQLNA